MMRKTVLLLLVLLLALPSATGLAETAPAGATVISCPEEDFSTLADFDCATEYVEGDGLYIKLSDQLMPYVLVSVDYGEKRVTDAEYYMNEVLAPHFIEAYKPNGALSSVVHGDGEINGRPTPVLEMQYRNSQGSAIVLVALFDMYPDYTVYYRTRWYREADRASALAAMETVARYLKPGADYYAAGADSTKASKPSRPSKGAQTTPEPAAPQTRDAAAEPMSFAVTPIVQGGMTMGRCTAPQGYMVQGKATCSVTDQSAGNPWLLRIAVQSEDGMSNMTYQSAVDYMDDANGQTQDGVYNSNYFTPMLHYMSAGDYCDYWLNRAVPDVMSAQLVEENSYPALQSLLRQRESDLLQTQRSLLQYTGLTADRVAVSLASRRYHVRTNSGLEYYFCVATATQGMWYTASLPGPYLDLSNSYILWSAPYVYTMLCPVRLWEARGGAFDVFVENTSASDQFMAANQKLSNELWDIITGRGATYADSYSEDVMRSETASGDDYDDERFTDYLFDQNDYTLSDGSHVKVSTAYDYVYEGDGGKVYYSDSAFAQPGGSIQLHPN